MNINLHLHITWQKYESNSVASTSELLETLDETFLQYYMDNDCISTFNSQPVAKGLIHIVHAICLLTYVYDRNK